MELLDLLTRRRSIRSFTADEVAREDLETILAAAQTAPTAGNLQAYQLVVVSSPEVKEELCRAAFGQPHVRSAPLDLVFLSDQQRSATRYGRRGELYSIQDASIACTLAMLAAHGLGYGTIWTGAFDDRMVHEVVQAAGHLRPVAILSVGRPAERPAPTPRRQIDSFVRYL